MSRTLKERLKKTRFSTYSFHSMEKQLKVEMKKMIRLFQNQKKILYDGNYSEFQASLKHVENELYKIA